MYYLAVYVGLTPNMLTGNIQCVTTRIYILLFVYLVCVRACVRACVNGRAHQCVQCMHASMWVIVFMHVYPCLYTGVYNTWTCTSVHINLIAFNSKFISFTAANGKTAELSPSCFSKLQGIERRMH